jgi:hypothetical protein
VDIKDQFHGSMYPSLGEGKFVSVKYNGPYLEIIGHDRHGVVPEGTIRLIPCQFNHGVMVEFVKDGKIQWRTHCDYNQFYKMGSHHEKSE